MESFCNCLASFAERIIVSSLFKNAHARVYSERIFLIYDGASSIQNTTSELNSFCRDGILKELIIYA